MVPAGARPAFHLTPELPHDVHALQRPHRLLTLALAVSQGTTARLAAQRSAEDARIIDGYRLTMPVLLKVLPALQAAPPSCRPREQRDPHTLSIAEMTRTLEQCAPVMQALRKGSVSARDAAIVSASMLSTAKAMSLHDGKASGVPAGPLHDNAVLLETNDAELRRVTSGSGQP